MQGISIRLLKMIMEKGNILFGVIMSVMATNGLETLSLVCSISGGRRVIEENVTVSGHEIEISLINGTRIVLDHEKREWVVRVEERENHTCYLADLKFYLPRFNFGFYEAHIASGSNSKIVYNAKFVNMLNFHSGKDALIETRHLSERAEKMCQNINLYRMSHGYAAKDRESAVCVRTCWLVCDILKCFDECVYVCP